MIPDEVTALPLYPHLDEIAGTLATRNLLMLHAEQDAGRRLFEGKSGLAPLPDDIRQAVRERLAREGLDALPWNDAARRFRDRCLFGKHPSFAANH